MLSEVFPEKDLVEIPYTHKLFSCYYKIFGITVNMMIAKPKIPDNSEKK